MDHDQARDHTQRIFVCVEVPDGRRLRVAALQRLLPDPTGVLKLAEPGHMHITIQFMGNLGPTQLEAVCLAAERTADSVPPFEIVVAGLGAFPNSHRPRVIWAGVTTGASELAKLRSAVEDELSRAGFPPEPARFTAHVTLARVRDGASPVDARRLAAAIDLALDADSAPIRFQASHLTVMRSELSRAGSIYTPLLRTGFRSVQSD